MNDVLETGTRQTNSLVVDMVSDLIFPWCFVAKRRVEKAAAILGQRSRCIGFPSS
jgi:predicted DsbA family dithiol-disulfide isomerase